MANITPLSSASSSSTSSPSSSSLTSSPETTFSLSQLLQNPTSLVTVTLVGPNFNLWSLQVESILTAAGYFKYLDGSFPCPPPEITDIDGNQNPNPKYFSWTTIDAYLLSYLRATISPTLLNSLKQFHLTHTLWSALTKRFKHLPRTHIQKLKYKLNSTRKNTLSMEEYISEISDIADQLALASAPVQEDDLVQIILHGLPPEYDNFTAAIRARTEPISIEDLSSILCSEEMHLENRTRQTPSHDLPTAFAATQMETIPNTTTSHTPQPPPPQTLYPPPQNPHPPPPNPYQPPPPHPYPPAP